MLILVLTPNTVSGITENNLIVTSANVFPNPVKNQFTVSLTLIQSARVRVTLNHISGKEVMPLSDSKLRS